MMQRDINHPLPLTAQDLK